MLAVATAALLGGCAPDGDRGAAVVSLDSIAEAYVKLALAVGRHDEGYIDAYYGPAAWRAWADSTALALPEITERAGALRARLAASAPPADAEELLRLRHAYLDRQLAALVSRVAMLEGKRFSFDEEARALYDAVAPTHDAAYFERTLAALDRVLPGRGSVSHRYQRFRDRFVIPAARLDTVFQAAIAECRARTARHVALPAGESFTVEYVTDKPWSGYNWYQGDLRSLIQVNTSLPVYIDRAVDLACHEGYPGHHLYNALLEHQLVRERGWREFTVYPLFSPQSLIAEGSANYGIRMAFPGGERVAFERAALFPLAGLPAERAEEYYRVQELVRDLAYADNEAARRYLNGEIDRAAAQQWIERYALRSPAAAAQRVRFIDTYRSYVINYNLGQDLVAEYVERVAGAEPGRRWEVFEQLLASPRLPSALR